MEVRHSNHDRHGIDSAALGVQECHRQFWRRTKGQHLGVGVELPLLPQRLDGVVLIEDGDDSTTGSASPGRVVETISCHPLVIALPSP